MLWESIIGTYLANRKIPTSTQGYTVISFDKGGEWTPVTPPATDSNGLPITCNLVRYYDIFNTCIIQYIILDLLFLALFSTSSHVY